MPGDPSLTDDDLQQEIVLVGALVLEASEADGPLSQERIDEILGVSDEEAAADPASAGGGDASAGGVEEASAG
ncbi:hypothetical protein [Phycicoccus sp.]|uniref:hypothetical protein n=1 Tax=Phycicoccus sp. TaxID=1902410 RepID=UPI002BCF6736|nr:hypothetical protein [Phycicoccus sp.]HMM96559.1 hypothetical protein [Phycicoccus sp.]